MIDKLPPTVNALIVQTVSELDQFGRNARPGEICIYHKGYLFKDRDQRDALEELTPKSRAIHNMANTAMSLEELGYVYLFQRRLGDQEYEYIAMRTTKGAGQPVVPALELAA